MAITYRKTATIKAEQFDGTKEAAERLGLFRYRGGWYLETLGGSLSVKIGYWIATGVNGEHWPITEDVFNFAIFCHFNADFNHLNFLQ